MLRYLQAGLIAMASVQAVQITNKDPNPEGPPPVVAEPGTFPVPKPVDPENAGAVPKPEDAVVPKP